MGVKIVLYMEEMCLCLCPFLFFDYVFKHCVTGERIAVEYLLAQSNRGDLLVPQQLPEISSQELEDDGGEPDVTVCQVAAVEAQVTLKGDSGPRSLDEDIIVEEDDTQDSTSDQVM